MIIWDWIALIAGVAGVFLTIKQSVWCWPLALTSVIISVIAFYNAKLYGDVFLNIFYVISGFYGWIYWNSKKNDVFLITKISNKWITYLFLITLIQIVIYWYILKKLNSDKIIFDAILTAFSFTATYMMARKWLENWILWIVIDAAYVVLYLLKELPVYALLYSFFTIMALYGFLTWNKQLKK